MFAESGATLIAPALPMARVAIGTPASIYTMESNESTPDSIDNCTNTPSTDKWILAAHMPDRWAAPPVPAMIAPRPQLSASPVY